MLLVYIEDYVLLTKILGYLDIKKILYTTDINNYKSCDSLLIYTDTNKGITLMKNMIGKKIVYLLYPDEIKILKHMKKHNKNSLNYRSRLYDKLNYSTHIVTSFIYFKNILKQRYKGSFYIIPLENKNLVTKKSFINLYKKYKFRKKNTVITIIDTNYELLNLVTTLASKYDDKKFVYIGFKTEEYLNNDDKTKLSSISKNIIKKYYVDQKQLEEIIRISKMVIFHDNILQNYDYLTLIILIGKQLIIRKQELCYKNFVNSKNCYLYENDKELLFKIDKYLKNDIGNLSYSALKLIENNDLKQIASKFYRILK